MIINLNLNQMNESAKLIFFFPLSRYFSELRTTRVHRTFHPFI